MSKFITVRLGEIGGEPQPTVDGRELWAHFKPHSTFANWMGNKLRQHGFVEGKDFERIGVRRIIRYGRTERVSHQVDYTMSLNMAERIGKVEYRRGAGTSS